MSSYVGVDPGYKGFVVLLNERGQIIDSLKMPVIESEWVKVIDGDKLSETFKHWQEEHDLQTVYLEKIRQIYVRGPKTPWKLVWGCGVVIWAAISNGLALLEISPSTWHSFAYGITKGTKKEMSEEWCRSRGIDMSYLEIGVRKKRISYDACEAVIIGRCGKAIMPI